MQVDLPACNGEFTLALVFSELPLEAGHHVRATLFDGFGMPKQRYVNECQDWQKTLRIWAKRSQGGVDEFLVGAMVLRCHEAKTFRGGTIAGLSIPEISRRVMTT